MEKGNRKTKYCKEPLLSKMKEAIYQINHEGKTITSVSVTSGIPKRSLRRYVKRSKDPNCALFFDAEYSTKQTTKPVWKPESTVPVFSFDDDQLLKWVDDYVEELELCERPFGFGGL